jgi:hypothetical protein
LQFLGITERGQSSFYGTTTCLQFAHLFATRLSL